MSQTILQINFKFAMAPADYQQAVRRAADAIAQLPGFQWKIWLMNEEAQEAGGIYQFEDTTSAQAYLEGPIVAQLSQMPDITDIQVKRFNSLDELTQITHGSIHY